MDALHAVGQQFLAHIRDLGGDEVRTAIGDFLPFCFATVGDAARRFADVEKEATHDGHGSCMREPGAGLGNISDAEGMR